MAGFVLDRNGNKVWHSLSAEDALDLAAGRLGIDRHDPQTARVLAGMDAAVSHMTRPDALQLAVNPSTAGETAKPTHGGDHNAEFRREYRAEPAYAASMTEAEYVAMRRVDEGLDELRPPGSLASAGKSWIASNFDADPIAKDEPVLV